MNHLEKQMLSLLIELKEVHHVGAVKAEFEAEGTRLDELWRLQDVALRAGLGLNLKIGGCEAIRDMHDAILLGAERIIAPMVETPYALKKFLNAVQMVFPEDVQMNTEFLVNIETITACNNFDDMLELPEVRNLAGVVIGRVDLVGSLYGDCQRSAVNNDEVQDICIRLSRKAKAKGLDVIVGGGVSIDSIPFFKNFPDAHIDRYETRKIIFDCPEALDNSSEAFLKAMEFELLWLKNKQQHYARLSQEDAERIKMLEKRFSSATIPVVSA